MSVLELENFRRASSTVDRRVVDIARKRRELGISLAELLRRARLAGSAWQAMMQGAKPRDETIHRLEHALNGQTFTPPTPAVITALYRMCATFLAAARGVPPEYVVALDFSAEKPNSPEWLAAARVRRIAMYVVTVELLVENVDLARAIGCSRQNIKRARDAVETWREGDAELDGLIARVASLAGQTT